MPSKKSANERWDFRPSEDDIENIRVWEMYSNANRIWIFRLSATCMFLKISSRLQPPRKRQVIARKNPYFFFNFRLTKSNYTMLLLKITTGILFRFFNEIIIFTKIIQESTNSKILPVAGDQWPQQNAHRPESRRGCRIALLHGQGLGRRERNQTRWFSGQPSRK